jgi:hypothetical protein
VFRRRSGDERVLLRHPWSVAGLAAALILAQPVAAATARETPQPRYEAPDRPLPASPATVAAIRGFQGSWLDRALKHQYELSGDVGLRNAPFIGTHNSYNSVAEMGHTISTSDANQQLSIDDQLDLDIRSLELDLHWFRRPSSGELAPVVCHAFPNHLGCSTEKALDQVLDEVNAWLRVPAHSDQVLFLYLEDHLDNRTGYDTAASVIQQKLGDVLYAPSGGGCERLPLELTRDRILRAGKRVIIVGNSRCGMGSAWPSKVFDWEPHLETRLRDFSDFPTCGPDFTPVQYDATQIRYFEDGRPSQAGMARITPDIAAQMTRCGVDLLGLDQLLPGDPRLSALVWSWAKGEPRKRGKCAVQTSKEGTLRTRWKAAGCGSHRRPACRKNDRWLVGARAVAKKSARAECRARDARFAVPRTGYEAQLLREAMRRAGVGKARLGYVKRRGDWVALDKRRP